MTELVHYRVEGAVASLVLDSQPNRNALSRQLVTELYDGLATAEADDDVLVVVIRAEGPRILLDPVLRETLATGAAILLVSVIGCWPEIHW